MTIAGRALVHDRQPAVTPGLVPAGADEGAAGDQDTARGVALRVRAQDVVREVEPGGVAGLDRAPVEDEVLPAVVDAVVRAVPAVGLHHHAQRPLGAPVRGAEVAVPEGDALHVSSAHVAGVFGDADRVADAARPGVDAGRRDVAGALDDAAVEEDVAHVALRSADGDDGAVRTGYAASAVKPAADEPRVVRARAADDGARPGAPILSRVMRLPAPNSRRPLSHDAPAPSPRDARGSPARRCGAAIGAGGEDHACSRDERPWSMARWTARESSRVPSPWRRRPHVHGDGRGGCLRRVDQVEVGRQQPLRTDEEQSSRTCEGEWTWHQTFLFTAPGHVCGDAQCGLCRGYEVDS